MNTSADVQLAFHNGLRAPPQWVNALCGGHCVSVSRATGKPTPLSAVRQQVATTYYTFHSTKGLSTGKKKNIYIQRRYAGQLGVEVANEGAWSDVKNRLHARIGSARVTILSTQKRVAFP